MKKMLILAAIVALLEPAAFAAMGKRLPSAAMVSGVPWRPTVSPIILIDDVALTSFELQTLLDAVHKEGLVDAKDASKRRLELKSVKLPPIDNFRNVAVPGVPGRSIMPVATKVTLVADIRQPRTPGAPAEFANLTMRLSQGRGQWLKAVINPVYAVHDPNPPAPARSLYNARLLSVVLGKAVKAPVRLPFVQIYKGAVQVAIRIASARFIV
ncbi:MAG: hypothetical protein AABZ44_00275 [Elusimicrobiota bacterium]